MTKRTLIWILWVAVAGLPGRLEAAASPQKIGFQGKLLDTANNPRNGNFDMTFRIFNAPTGGTELWSETQSGVPVNNGVFSVQLGANAALTAGLFNSASAYLEVQVAPDSAMTPRQQLLMSAYSFRALTADSLAAGDTNYIQVRTSLQNGAAFHVSSATVAGLFTAAGPSSFTAAGNQAYSLETSSGIKMAGGTLRIEGLGGLEALGPVKAATFSATAGLLLPQGAASSAEGAARWEPAQNLLFIGTGTASKTMVDTDSAQTMTNKTLSSSGGNTVDATHLKTREISSVSPGEGMTLEWNAASAQWTPNYASTVSVVMSVFAPTNLTATLVANTVYLSPFTISGYLTLNQIRYRIGTAAAGVTGDVGLYDSSGNLIASGGANSADFTSTGVKVVNVLGAPKVIRPGQYYAAITANGGGRPRVVNVGDSGVVKGLGSIASVGGSTLPGSVTLSTVVDGTWGLYMSFLE